MPRKLKEISKQRFRYGYGPPYCTVCGQSTDSLSTRCERCLEAQFHKDELTFMGEWLRSHPNAKIELAKDKKKVMHLVMLRTPGTAWCGGPVNEARDTRKAFPATQFPPGICQACLTVHGEIAL